MPAPPRPGVEPVAGTHPPTHPLPAVLLATAGHAVLLQGAPLDLPNHTRTRKLALPHPPPVAPAMPCSTRDNLSSSCGALRGRHGGRGWPPADAA